MSYDPTMEAMLEDDRQTAKRENPCTQTWGHCGEGVVYFGPPSDTPHRCAGGKKHRSKLHICAACGRVGHRNRPAPFSRAERELRDIVAAKTREVTARSAGA